jgi:hypothetical protein
MTIYFASFSASLIHALARFRLLLCVYIVALMVGIIIFIPGLDWEKRGGENKRLAELAIECEQRFNSVMLNAETEISRIPMASKWKGKFVDGQLFHQRCGCLRGESKRRGEKLISGRKSRWELIYSEKLIWNAVGGGNLLDRHEWICWVTTRQDVLRHSRR